MQGPKQWTAVEAANRIQDGAAGLRRPRFRSTFLEAVRMIEEGHYEARRMAATSILLQAVLFRPQYLST
jgi:hypothetical protein